MYALFAWRYFRSKKSTGAIQIIARLALCIIAFATCCQLLVLSVYNGFEDIVQQLYSKFYADIKVVPFQGKYLEADSVWQLKITQNTSIMAMTGYVEEKALLKNGDIQTVVRIRGVDENFGQVSGVPQAVKRGRFQLGDSVRPGLVLGAGVQYALAVDPENKFNQDPPVLILPKAYATSNDITESLTEAYVYPQGSFSIQQDFDNYYAFTRLDFLRQQMHLYPNAYSALEIKLKPGTDAEKVKEDLQKTLGSSYKVQTREAQNMSLYRTMKTEKWVIFLILTFILIIAAFNIISALTMLVIEKKKDIQVLQSLGSPVSFIRAIFLSEGLLLGILGIAAGVLMALGLCFAQWKWKWLKIRGGSFLIDYFPVKIYSADILLIVCTAFVIVLFSSWIPANKAAGSTLDLK
jgi:lipoprotein-releasing system permease protein